MLLCCTGLFYLVYLLYNMIFNKDQLTTVCFVTAFLPFTEIPQIREKQEDFLSPPPLEATLNPPAPLHARLKLEHEVHLPLWMVPVCPLSQLLNLRDWAL